MSSSAAKNRLRLAQEIQSGGHPATFPCDRCFCSGKECIVMESRGRLKCSECVRIGRPCVNLSWESLDRTREEYRKKVEADEEELGVVLARLMRNKKILKQAEERAKKKAECLMAEMEDNGELEEDCPAADSTVGVSPATWSTIDLVNQSVGTVGSEWLFAGPS